MSRLTIAVVTFWLYCYLSGKVIRVVSSSAHSLSSLFSHLLWYAWCFIQISSDAEKQGKMDLCLLKKISDVNTINFHRNSNSVHRFHFLFSVAPTILNAFSTCLFYLNPNRCFVASLHWSYENRCIQRVMTMFAPRCACPSYIVSEGYKFWILLITSKMHICRRSFFGM